MMQRSAIRDWSSLTPDLISRVGDLLLDTGDVDGYMDMRAVCRGWRSAVADPRLHGAADPRFCPRQWVMLDDEDNLDQGRLFVNITTGRLLRRRIPLLPGQALVGASDGLLVLAYSLRPDDCRILNPFTHSMVRFAAPIRMSCGSLTVAVAAGSDPMLLLATTHGVRGPQAWLAHPSSTKFYRHPAAFTGYHIAAVVSYAGQIYLAYSDGSVYRRVGTAQHGHEEPMIADGNTGGQPVAVFLVESAGQLLLVLRQRFGFRVFTVDVEQKKLRKLRTSIGGRALFLGRRCLSVAADKFPGIEGDCLYYDSSLYSDASLFNTLNPELHGIYRFKIRDGSKVPLSRNLQRCRPLSIARVFLAYCLNLPDVWDQLRLGKVKSIQV